MKRGWIALLLGLAACDGASDQAPPPPEPVAPELGAVRAIVVDYLSGDPADGRDKWCEPDKAAALEARLAELAPYEPNVSAALAGNEGFASVSLQLLRSEADGMSALSDGGASVRARGSDPGQVCIHSITLQPPPVPLAA